MPLCGGHGGTAPKPGYPQVVIVSGAAVEAALITESLGVLAVPLSGLLAGTVYTLTTICGSDPPTDPMLTAADIASALNPYDPVTFEPALARVQQWFLSWYWYLVCQCADGTSPGATPAPSNPGPVAGPNPNQPPVAGAQPCWDVSQTYTLPPNNVQVDCTPESLPFTSPHTVTATFPLPTSAGTIPPGTTQISFTGTLTGGGFGANDPLLELDEYKADGTHLITQNVFTWAAVGTKTATINLSAGATYWTLTAYNPGAASPPQTLALETSFFCGGASAGTLNTPCCPPDPILSGKIEQLLGLTTALYSALPAVVSSYADGHVHAGLSGDGTITLVGDALAIRVNITTDSAHLGVAAGFTPYLFDRGFVVAIADATPIKGVDRLVFNPQLFPLPQLTDQVGYSLSPGVIITITELIRGP